MVRVCESLPRRTFLTIHQTTDKALLPAAVGKRVHAFATSRPVAQARCLHRCGLAMLPKSLHIPRECMPCPPIGGDGTPIPDAYAALVNKPFGVSIARSPWRAKISRRIRRSHTDLDQFWSSSPLLGRLKANVANFKPDPLGTAPDVVETGSTSVDFGSNRVDRGPMAESDRSRPTPGRNRNNFGRFQAKSGRCRSKSRIWLHSGHFLSELDRLRPDSAHLRPKLRRVGLIFGDLGNFGFGNGHNCLREGALQNEWLHPPQGDGIARRNTTQEPTGTCGGEVA